MIDVVHNVSTQSSGKPTKHGTTVLVLQGGGAQGAYQAGVYQGLAESGIVPNWIAGVSIGAINAALIAGNPPEHRLERLREFWDCVSSVAPFVSPASFDPFRPILNYLSAATVATLGVPGFFTPRIPPPFFAPEGTSGALSVYDTIPLNDTLHRLVDFDLINRRAVRLSLGAVNVTTGNSVYFDNQQTRISPDHVRASGALPPGFPAVQIEDEHYWDGGLVSNTPLWYVLDDSPKMNALIVQVDLFNSVGQFPKKLDQVLERDKDIRYSSRSRFNTRRITELAELRTALKRLLDRLPPEFATDPDFRKLSEACGARKITIAHLINRRLSHASQSKDYEFSRATVNELWAAGLADVRRAVANSDWANPKEMWEGVRVFDLTR